MPRPLTTEDIEFRTDLDTRGNVVRRGRFIRRPRRVNGRTVPGNARYYRARQRQLLAQRGGRAARRARSTARGGTPSVSSEIPFGTAPRSTGGGARQVAPRGRSRRGGVRGALARAARGAANALARRRQRRR